MSVGKRFREDIVTIRRLMFCALCGSSALTSMPAMAGESAIWAFHGNFGGGSSHGSLLLRKDDVFYGTAGAPTQHEIYPGIVFELKNTTLGWKLKDIHYFKGGLDGADPQAGLIANEGGALFGTTLSGGETGDDKPRYAGGTVFKLSPPLPKSGSTAWTETVLYRFPETDLSQPFGSLIFGKGGVLYGTARVGGPANAGGVFELIPPPKGETNWKERTLYAFKGGADGEGPAAALLMDSSGALYGTTTAGGGGYNNFYCNGSPDNLNGCGTVFKLAPPAGGKGGWTETVLYAFSGGSDGAIPYSTLVSDSAGNLYGTTKNAGPQNSGNVFELTPPAAGMSNWTETTLYVFQGAPDSELATAGVVFGPDGALYGTSIWGGSTGNGNVYKVSPPQGAGATWTASTVYSFQGGSDGSQPYDSVTFDAAGNLFGTTLIGGITLPNGDPGYGTIFEISP